MMVGTRTSTLLRRITTLLIICCSSAVVLSPSAAAALPGSGTQEDPYRIESLADFDEFATDSNYWDDFARLETDVNLAGRTYSAAVIAPDESRSNYFQGTTFTGVFDGNDHRIINLTINGSTNDYLGLFGYIIDGEVKNLRLEDGSIRGGYLVGGLVGDNRGSISNCYSTGFVWGNNYVGGLVGVNEDRTIANCYSTGDVNSSGCVGGLVGSNHYGSILNCYSTGDVSGGDYVGGLVGINNEGSISNCYSTGNVNGTKDSIGGLVGINMEGSISNCYSTGNVNGTYLYVGGLVGFNNYGSISNCYSAGDVNGVDYVGGLAGENDGMSSISNSFWDTNTQTHGVTETIGLNKGTIINVSGLTTAQMQTKSTFTDAGWDFVGETINGPNDIWRMCVDGVQYPLLSWQFIPDFTCPDGVDILDLAFFVDRWLADCDETNNSCNCTDINYDAQVDFGDLAIFASRWLEGTADPP